MSRASEIYGEGYTMADVCKGCQQRHRCASCLDGSASEYLPPSALERMVKTAAAKGSGCSPLMAGDRCIGFVCKRGGR